MNLKTGFPFWLIKDGLPFQYPKLDRDVDTEVIVLGAGITGALVRHYLVEAGIPCVAVDARTIGLGSTCASTSLLQYEIDTPLSKLIDLVGKDHAERAYRLCGEAVRELGVLANLLEMKEFEFKKSLYYATYKKDVTWLKAEFEARKAAGFEVRWLSAEAVQDQYGFLAHGAILSELAAQTNAYEMTHRLLQFHGDALSPVYDRTPITQIKHQKSGVALRSENGFVLRAKTLVYAPGYEVVEFLGKDIVKLLSTYAVASEQYDTARFWKDNVLIWNTANPYLYLRTTSDQRVIVGGRDEMFYNPKKRDALLPKKTQQLSNDCGRLFPSIDFKPEFSWTGTFGSTKDGLPYIGPYKKFPNSYFALGFGGNGITFSVTAAQIVRDLILGKDNPDVSIFSFGRH